MSYNGAGTFVINSSGQPAVAGTAITATAFNALTADLATGLSTALCKDGQSTATANIPMGGFKLTGLADGSAATDSVAFGQLRGSTASYLTVSGGTTITANATPALTSYVDGQMFWFRAASTCGAAATLNIDGLGAKNLIVSGTGTTTSSGAFLANANVVVIFNSVRNAFFIVSADIRPTLGATSSFSSTNSTTIGSVAGSPTTINSSNITIPNNLAFDTDVLFVDAANNRVGVGTTTPALLFSVVSAAGADAPVLIKAPSTNSSILNFGDAASDTVGQIKYDHTSDTLTITTNGTVAATITSAQRVGIGTATPGQLLTVAGTIESTSGGVKFPDATTQTSASKVLQQVSASSSAYASGTSTTPADDTIPQQTEGTEFLTVSITPKSASSNLLIEVNANLSIGGSGTVTSSLFRDVTTNAIAAQGQYLQANELFVSVVKVIVAAGSTSATTFKFRAGGNAGQTIGLNGVSAARLYGGVSASTITVTEILP